MPSDHQDRLREVPPLGAVKVQPGAVTIRLWGPIDASRRRELERVVDQVLDRYDKPIRVDLSEVEVLDPECLRWLSAAARRWRPSGTELTIVALSETAVAQMVRDGGFDDLLPLVSGGRGASCEPGSLDV